MKNLFNYEITGSWNDQIYLAQESYKELFILKFDSQLRLREKTELPLPVKRSKRVGYFQKDNKFTIFSTHIDSNKLCIDRTNYVVNNQIKVVKQIGKMSSNIINVYPLIVSKSKNAQILKFQNDDEDLIFTLIGQEDDTIRYQTIISQTEFYEEDYELGSNYLSENGTLVCFFYKKDEVLLIRINPFGQYSLSHFKVGVMPANEFKMAYNEKNGQIFLLGIQYDEKRKYQFGINMFLFNELENQFVFVQSLPFDKNTMDDYFDGSGVRNPGLTAFKILNPIFREDGGLVIVMEETKEIVRFANNTPRYGYAPSRPTIDYYNEDVIVTSISNQYKFEWQKLLKKYQYSYDDNAQFSSYFLHINPSSLRFIFNDEIKSENTVSEYVINPYGNIERRVLINTEKNEMSLQIRNSFQLSGKTTIIPSVKKNNLKLVRLDY